MADEEEIPWENLSFKCHSITNPDDRRLNGVGKDFVDLLPGVELAMGKALDALISFLVSSDARIRSYAGSVCQTVVKKCLSSRNEQRSIVDKAQEVLNLFVELEAVEPVLTALEKAVKNELDEPIPPSAAIDLMVQILSDFGSSIVRPARILSMLPELLMLEDKKACASAVRLALELARWVGEDPLRSFVIVQLTEELAAQLVEKMAGVQVNAALPTRKRIRSVVRNEALGSVRPLSPDAKTGLFWPISGPERDCIIKEVIAPLLKLNVDPELYREGGLSCISNQARLIENSAYQYSQTAQVQPDVLPEPTVLNGFLYDQRIVQLTLNLLDKIDIDGLTALKRVHLPSSVTRSKGESFWPRPNSTVYNRWMHGKGNVTLHGILILRLTKLHQLNKSLQESYENSSRDAFLEAKRRLLRSEEDLVKEIYSVFNAAGLVVSNSLVSALPLW